MIPPLVDALRFRPLPGDPRLTWLDLVDQVALEHRVSANDILWGVRRPKIVQARRHIFGALVGAGLSRGAIARGFRVTTACVSLGVQALSRGQTVARSRSGAA